MVFAMLDLCTAAISGESAYAIVPELFLSRDKVLGTAIVGIFQVFFALDIKFFAEFVWRLSNKLHFDRGKHVWHFQCPDSFRSVQCCLRFGEL